MNKMTSISGSAFERAVSASQTNITRKGEPSGAGHIDRPMSDISIAYLQSAENFIAGQVFPRVAVEKQSDLYYVYDRGDFNRNTMRMRAPDAQSVGDSYSLATEPYYCPVYSLHRDIPDVAPLNADKPIDMYRDTTVFLTQKALIFRESMWAEKFFVQGSGWATELTSVPYNPYVDVPPGMFVSWGDRDHSSPISDIELAKQKQKEETGFDPNTLVLGRKVYDALTYNQDLVDRVKYGQTPGNPAKVDRQSMAKILEVDRVLVMNAIENLSPEGQLARHEFIGGDNALLCYVPPNPGLMTPSAGYHFTWEYSAYAREGISVSNMRMPRIRANRLEVELSFDSRMVGAELGTLFVGAA